MKEKTGNILSQTVNSVMMTGGIILLIGLYYSMVKAGIPYQDPPLELQIQYAVNLGIGETLTGKGFAIALCGAAARLILWLARKANGRRRENSAGGHASADVHR